MPSGLLQRLQRGVALESLGESGSSFRAESVFRETASMGAGVGAEGCQWGLTQKQPLLGAAAHSRLEIIVSLRMAASAEAPLSPTSLSRILRGKMGGGSGERAGGCQQALTRTEYSGAAPTPGS